MIKNIAKIISIILLTTVSKTIFAGEASPNNYKIYLDFESSAVNGPSTFYYTDKSTIIAYNNNLKDYLAKNRLNKIQDYEPFVRLYQQDKKRIFRLPGTIAIPYCMLANKKNGNSIKLDADQDNSEAIYTIENNGIPFEEELNTLKEKFETLDNYSQNLLSIGLIPNETVSSRLSYLLAAGILAKQKKEDGTVHYIHGPNSYAVKKKEAIIKLLEDKKNIFLNRITTYTALDIQKTTIEYLFALKRH